MTAKVTIHDCKKAGYCRKGVRLHCELLGIDFKQLVRVGINIEELEHIEDAAVQKIIAQVKGRQ